MGNNKGRSRLLHDISLRSVKLLNTFLVCAPLAFIWLTFYSKQIYGGEFGPAGNWAFITAYVILYAIFARIYDAFQLTQVGRAELFFSQVIALFLTDILFFLILAALLRAWPELFRFIVCVLLQIIVSLVWCIAVSEWYTRTFDKRKAVIIYDSIHNLHEISRHKQFKKNFDLMGTYDIDEVKFSTASDRKAWLIDKIKDTDAVFVMELHSHDRNIIVKYCVEHEISCYNEPKIGDILMRSSKQFNMYNVPMTLVERYYPNPEYVFLKRLGDILLSCLTLVVASPVFLVTALVIKISDGGPVIYKQKRLTLNGKIFEIYKFRSMKVDAEKETGAVLSSGTHDPRVSNFGRFLRKSRIDELPQLINIIKGDMSIVGPRPERPEIAERYSKDLPEFKLRLQVRAGLTGYAQVYGRYDSDPYDKLSMDLHYIANAGVSEDIRILLATLKRIIAKEPELNWEDEDVDA